MAALLPSLRAAMQESGRIDIGNRRFASAPMARLDRAPNEVIYDTLVLIGCRALAGWTACSRVVFRHLKVRGQTPMTLVNPWILYLASGELPHDIF